MKKILALLLGVSLVLGMSACSKTDSDEGKDVNQDNQQSGVIAELPEGPVEIELWTDMTIDPTILTDAIEKFEATYASQGYTVVLNQFAGSQRSALISAAKETNTLPALLFSAWFTTSDYAHQGMIVDISDIGETVKNDMYGSAYDSTLISGKSYMVGLYQSYFGFLYNADMLKVAGLEDFVPEDPNKVTIWTLDEMEKDILPTLASYMNGTEKYPIGFFAADNQADTFMMNWLTMLGGNMWEGGYSSAGNDTNTIAALEKMISWTNSGLTNSNVVTKSGSEVGGEFTNQVSAISSGQFTNYVNNLKAMEKGEIETFDMRIAAIPVQKDGKDSATMANYVYGASVMNNGNEDQIAVAKEFIKWLLNDEESLTEINANAIPCYKSITEALSDEQPIYEGLTEMEPYIWDFTGGVAGYVSTRALLFPELQAAFSGDKTATQALTDYSTAANDVIQEYLDNSLILK